MKKIYAILFIFSILFAAPCYAKAHSFLTEDEIPTASEFLLCHLKPLMHHFIMIGTAMNEVRLCVIQSVVNRL